MTKKEEEEREEKMAALYKMLNEQKLSPEKNNCRNLSNIKSTILR